MIFLTFYFLALIVVIVLGFTVEWFQNPKGKREIDARTALIFVGLAVCPILNMVCAVMFVIIFIAFLPDIFGAVEWFDRLRFKTLFTDRK